MVIFLDPDQDPQVDSEVMIILKIIQEISPQIDLENVKMKEEEVGVSLLFFITLVC